ncbi:uncharacterized protein MKK02DRAFT_32170 [Dioszegia hungarica]|uniref:Zn(2)-C6 fungal-type domain-containing protein n=1 Tax=Dioszegia hungarica TaxID=4972 RepID=A0AA38HE40_9TREE|nr:uncharacterized protein MKK02DRAFT_32170 [Dioszegia hungarica]KAI9637286.1 hypothetical protein MKK02DRAFT_32170 [Dioszegia hungarica]
MTPGRETERIPSIFVRPLRPLPAPPAPGPAASLRPSPTCPKLLTPPPAHLASTSPTDDDDGRGPPSHSPALSLPPFSRGVDTAPLPSTATNPPKLARPKGKSGKRATACRDCHARKQKCSQGTPCSHCHRRGTNCTYPAHHSEAAPGVRVLLLSLLPQPLDRPDRPDPKGKGDLAHTSLPPPSTPLPHGPKAPQRLRLLVHPLESLTTQLRGQILPIPTRQERTASPEALGQPLQKRRNASPEALGSPFVEAAVLPFMGRDTRPDQTRTSVAGGHIGYQPPAPIPHPSYPSTPPSHSPIAPSRARPQAADMSSRFRLHPTLILDSPEVRAACPSRARKCDDAPAPCRSHSPTGPRF